MLIDLSEVIIYLPKSPDNVLHIGAHLGEDKVDYDKHKIPNVFYVEPNPELYPILCSTVGWTNCINLAVAAKEGQKLPFYKVYSKDRTNMGCSSLMKPTLILDNPYLEQLETIDVYTTTIDFLNDTFGPFSLINMDIQGMELEALKGATKTLKNKKLQGLLLEFTTVSLYENDCKLDELDKYLDNFGFYRVITVFADSGKTWGDCLFVRKTP